LSGEYKKQTKKRARLLNPRFPTTVLNTGVPIMDPSTPFVDYPPCGSILMH